MWFYDPIRNELFTAVRGEGAKLNEVRLRVDSQNELNGAILATVSHSNNQA